MREAAKAILLAAEASKAHAAAVAATDNATRTMVARFQGLSSMAAAAKASVAGLAQETEHMGHRAQPPPFHRCGEQPAALVRCSKARCRYEPSNGSP